LGVGFGFASVPQPLIEEAERLSFPVLAVPYDVPFVAITKAAFAHLANERLESLSRALEMHDGLAHAVLRGRGLQAAARLGVHRHTLRYRMDRLSDQTGRHPDDPEPQMELWLAIKARQALKATEGRVPA
jgi:hypothetical protein